MLMARMVAKATIHISLDLYLGNFMTVALTGLRAVSSSFPKRSEERGGMPMLCPAGALHKLRIDLSPAGVLGDAFPSLSLGNNNVLISVFGPMGRCVSQVRSPLYYLVGCERTCDTPTPRWKHPFHRALCEPSLGGAPTS